MSQSNISSTKSDSKIQMCRTKQICENKLIVCLEIEKCCNFRYYFGDSVFCTDSAKSNFLKQKK